MCILGNVDRNNILYLKKLYANLVKPLTSSYVNSLAIDKNTDEMDR